MILGQIHYLFQGWIHRPNTVTLLEGVALLVEGGICDEH